MAQQRKPLSKAAIDRAVKAQQIPTGLSQSDRSIIQGLRAKNAKRTPTKIQAKAIKAWNRRRTAQANATEVRRQTARRVPKNPLATASRLAKAYVAKHERNDPDVRDRVRVFFLPTDPSTGRARWSVRSWRKFMSEEKYNDAVKECLLHGDFVLGAMNDDGDMDRRDRIATLIKGV